MKSIWLLVIVAILPGCLLDPALKLPFDSYEPEQLSDGWEVSSPESEGFDAQQVKTIYEKLFDENEFPTARGLLIIRHGHLVAEAYCKTKTDRDKPHALQSATKSVTSMATGIAIDQGLISSVDQKIYEFIPEYFDQDPKKHEITLYHALTMQTGLAFVNDDHTGELINCDGSSLEYVLHKSLRFNPGASFYYNDGDPQLISGVIQAVSGKSLDAYARENLFQPLGITNYLWEASKDGVNYGAVGLWLKPRDMARIGQLMLQNGLWQGEQIISPEWIAESTAIHANTNYGYYWWNYGWEGAFMAIGRGEQIIYVNQPESTVVVLITDAFSDEILSPGIQDLVFDVMDAIIE